MRIRIVAALVVSVLFAAVAAAQSADLFVTTSGPGSATEGSNITYTVTVRNAGPDDASNATLTDTLPSNGTFVSSAQTSGAPFTCSTPNVGDAGGTVTCSIATFVAGQTATFQIVVNAPSGTAGMTLINNATVSSDTADENSENNSAVAGTTIAGGDLADVAVTKTGPLSVAPGGNVTFTITVSDSGPNDALAVALNDTLGAGLTFVSFAQTGGPAFSCPGNTTPCTIQTLPNGSTATFQLVATASNSPGTYSNTATVKSQNDPNPENDSAVASVIVSSADVSVVKTANSPTVIAGSPTSFTITVANGGPDPAENVYFTDTLPPGLTFVSIPQTSGPPATCTSTSSSVSCLIGQMLNGQSSVFTLNTQSASTIANGTVLSNTVNVTSETSDSNAGNNSSTATVTAVAQADLAIVKSGPASATPGVAFAFSITVSNSGPSTATGVNWSDVLPAGTTFVSLNQTTGPAFTCTTGATINCSIASFAPSTPAAFTLTVLPAPSATGVVSNTANVTSTTTDTNVTNNSSTATTALVAAADLGVTKTGPVTGNVGQQMAFTITVNNAGPSDAVSVTLTDVLPASLTFVSMNQTGGTPAFACSGTTTVTCTAPTMPAGATATFNLTTAVNSPGTSSNTATVSSTTTDPNGANNSATQPFSTLPVADLAVTKTAPSVTSSGANLSYTITVTNNGPSPAASVVLTDTLPANTSFVSMNQTGGTTSFSCSGTTTVTCSAATMNAGSSATFNLTVLVNSGPAIANTATVSSATLDLTPANNSSTATTPVAFGGNVPTLSPFALALLALALAAIAMKR